MGYFLVAPYWASLTFSSQSTALPSLTLVNGDMGHGDVGSRIVPVLFVGREPDDITDMDFFDRVAPALNEADASRDDQCLAFGPSLITIAKTHSGD